MLVAKVIISIVCFFVLFFFLLLLNAELEWQKNQVITLIASSWNSNYIWYQIHDNIHSLITLHCSACSQMIQLWELWIYGHGFIKSCCTLIVLFIHSKMVNVSILTIVSYQWEGKRKKKKICFIVLWVSDVLVSQSLKGSCNAV